MFDFSRVNEDQKKAVTTTDGPVLIIAGPGTGKTFTLVKRIAYLVLEKHVTPSEIMAVTFTEKAARELLTRISDEFLKYDAHININEMYIGTFHAVCLRLLKENSEYSDNDKPLRMMDAFEQSYLVCRNIEAFNCLHDYSKIFTSGSRWKQAQEICRYVNQIMEELTDVDALLSDRDRDMRFLGKVAERYRDLLKRNRVMDFSSIQTRTWQMLKEHPSVLEKIRQSIRYIMVDEYQDTNYIQEQLVFLLAGDRKNICVVSIVPCTAKKYERTRPEMQVDGVEDIDVVLTTRELGQLINRTGIIWNKLPNEDFDHDIVGENSGAGVIFGVTGGVMEAAIRTAYHLLTGAEMEPIVFQPCRGLDSVKEASLSINGTNLNIAITSGMKNAKVLLDEIRAGKSKYDFIEVMGCPGGCINGGGQPYVFPVFLPNEDHDIWSTYKEKRAQVLYDEDKGKPIRYSHRNPDIIKLYKDYLQEPGSHIAEKLLHTTYNEHREQYPEPTAKTTPVTK